MFFFQAEDGIRDDLVTGVQTCALPISWGAVLVHVRQSTVREQRSDTLGNGDHGSCYTRLGHDVRSGCTHRNARRAQPYEIGRASCRERVKISVGAVSLKKKKLE